MSPRTVCRLCAMLKCNDIGSTVWGAILLLGMINLTAQTVLIGIEVMEMEDLAKIHHLINKVGSLEYGDECRNNAIEDIASDVCFKSNPYLQCLDGICRCAYVRLHGEEFDTHKQMQHFQGSCRGLENFTCFSDAHCGDGLNCGVLKTPRQEELSVSSGSWGNAVENDLPVERNVQGSSKSKYRSMKQRILKAKVEALSRQTYKGEDSEYESKRLNPRESEKENITGLSGIQNGDDVSNDLVIQKKNPEERSGRSKPEADEPKNDWNEVRVCVTSGGNKFRLETSDKYKLTILATLFHLSGWRFCMKSSLE